jgi:hypothetical protein
VRRRLLHVPERHPGVERGGDEGMAKRVWADELGDTCTPCHPSDDPASTVAIEAVAVGSEEDRSLAPLADCKVDGPGCVRREWDGHDLAPLSQDGKGSMSAFEAKCFDVGTGRL